MGAFIGTFGTLCMLKETGADLSFSLFSLIAFIDGRDVFRTI